jgi:hypothetical protein
VGRPITKAENKIKAANDIVAEIRGVQWVKWLKMMLKNF